MNRGDSYRQQGLNLRAIEDLNSAIRLNSQNAAAYAVRAMAYFALGHEQEAEGDIATAVALGFDRAGLEAAIEEIKGQR